MPDKAQAWRRWFGLVFLALAFGMLVWGQTVLKPRLEGRAYVIYWLICFLFTSLALFTALLDIRAVRRRLREDQHTLVRKTIEELEGELTDDTDSSTSARRPKT